ncbi:MAG: hypothetical protein K2Y21_03215 [Phycisphaerales bacterium]|nr:hypothetical protein [Phycisphaerales bacterium]
MSLKLLGAGSMQAEMRCGRRVFTLYPGYATDVLGELLGSTLELIESSGIMRVVPEKGPEYEAPIRMSPVWDCEPGHFRWDFTYVSPEQLRISLSKMPPGKKRAGHEQLFDTEISAKVWCEILLSNAARILRRHGLAGYKAAWINHEFPVGRYLRLLAYRKHQFQFGMTGDDFDPAERTSLSRELRLLRQEIG